MLELNETKLSTKGRKNRKRRRDLKALADLPVLYRQMERERKAVAGLTKNQRKALQMRFGLRPKTLLYGSRGYAGAQQPFYSTLTGVAGTVQALRYAGKL